MRIMAIHIPKPQLPFGSASDATLYFLDLAKINVDFLDSDEFAKIVEKRIFMLEPWSLSSINYQGRGVVIGSWEREQDDLKEQEDLVERVASFWVQEAKTKRFSQDATFVYADTHYNPYLLNTDNLDPTNPKFLPLEAVIILGSRRNTLNPIQDVDIETVLEAYMSTNTIATRAKLELAPLALASVKLISYVPRIGETSDSIYHNLKKRVDQGLRSASK